MTVLEAIRDLLCRLTDCSDITRHRWQNVMLFDGEQIDGIMGIRFHIKTIIIGTTLASAGQVRTTIGGNDNAMIAYHLDDAEMFSVDILCDSGAAIRYADSGAVGWCAITFRQIPG